MVENVSIALNTQIISDNNSERKIKVVQRIQLSWKSPSAELLQIVISVCNRGKTEQIYKEYFATE